MIKIDTEGYELPVLQGAKETLKHTRKVIAEIHKDDDMPVIRQLLEDSGFNTRMIAAPYEVHIIGERE